MEYHAAAQIFADTQDQIKMLEIAFAKTQSKLSLLRDLLHRTETDLYRSLEKADAMVFQISDQRIVIVQRTTDGTCCAKTVKLESQNVLEQAS